MAVLKKPNCECFPLDFLVVFRESLWLDPTGHYCSLLTSVYFCLQQLNRSQLGIIALSGARYKPLAFDTTKKKLHWWVCERRWWFFFFFLCRRRWRFTSLLLSSFNWFSVAIGADLFFFFLSLPWTALQRTLFRFMSTRMCLESSSRYCTYHCSL